MEEFLCYYNVYFNNVIKENDMVLRNYVNVMGFMNSQIS